jgi:glutamate/tyrosine decarboxylase-like PLP-dependent enzyme
MSAEFEAWRQALSIAPGLSRRFVVRHARVLSGLVATADVERRERALMTASTDPQGAARQLHGMPAPGHDHAGHRELRAYEGPAAAVERVKAWVAGRCVDCAVRAEPPLQRTWVPLHPARRVTLLTGHDDPLVALVWPRLSVPDRQSHQRTMQELADRVNGVGVARHLRLVVPSNEVVIVMSEGDPWVVAEDHGMTLEDQLREHMLSPAVRSAAVDTLARLRRSMLEHGLVWQGFAPRNMFLRDDELRLIDFEECVATNENPVRAAECLEWHRIFFADCLTPAESAVVFAPHPGEVVINDERQLPADDFERALLESETITWRARRELLGQTCRIEGRHSRRAAERDGGVLFGHELGHFWGDFLPVAVEARLFRQIAPLDEPALVACLEMFEAAMEADIDSQLRAAAFGESMPVPARTVALAEALESHGVEAAVRLRRGVAGWYRDLETRPAALVDQLLFTLRRTVGDPSAYLVGDPNRRAQHRQHLIGAVDAGLAFVHADERGERFLNHREPDDLRDLLAESLPVGGADLDDVMKDVDERVVLHSISQGHPGYLAFPDTGNSVAALAGSMLTRLLNQNMIAVDRSAPAATFATIQVIEWLRELVGYDAKPITALRGVRDVAGLWTTGGHLSNHIAMLAALGRRFPDARSRGLRALDSQPAVVMAGPIAHYSHSDAAFHLGLGWDAVLQVPARPDFTTDPAAIEEVLANPPDGVTPFIVVGVAGNCRTTGLDDLAAIAEVCQRHGVWFHADACHGGSLLFNERLRRQCLAGIEAADSVSLDPHKGLFTPYPSSYVVFRDRGVLNQFSRHTATVEQDGAWDLGLVTPFVGSCGFEALPTWMMIKHIGVERLGDLVESRHALVRHIERRLDDSGLFVRLNDVDFYRSAFVFSPPAVRAVVRTAPTERRQHIHQAISAFTSRLNTMLYRRGEVCFDEHTLSDLDNRVGCGADTKYTIMACCPGNPLTTIEQLDHAVDRLVEAASALVTEMVANVTADLPPMAAGRLSGPAGWSDS